MSHHFTLKNDKFRKIRGGYSRILDISCNSCDSHLCFYQKDGPGILKRMYVDRMIGLTIKAIDTLSHKQLPPLECTKCHMLLAIPMVYKKENRLAYRLFVDAVSKKRVKS